MKTINPPNCGLSSWACLETAENGGFLVSRVSGYWLDRLPGKIALRAQSPSGVELAFYSDTEVLEFNYEIISAHLGEKICILVDAEMYVFELVSGGRQSLCLKLDGYIILLLA